MQGKRGAKMGNEWEGSNGKLLSGGISRRADREENPDRDKI
jgi:hypothetical protein